MAQIRGFNPAAVKREHISPRTLLYGSDVAGIKLRLDRFEEILIETHENPVVYANVSEAIGYISAGDMFSDSICVIIKNVSDMLKTSTESKNLYKTFMNSVKTYDDNSIIVLGAPQEKKTAAIEKLIEDYNNMGGICRGVAAPNDTLAETWLEEYGKSIGQSISADDKKKLLAISKGDVETIQNIINVVGAELSNLSVDDIAKWMDKEEDYNGQTIRSIIISRDLSRLQSFYNSFKYETSGYRMFLLKLRLNLLDLLIASYGEVTPLITYKQNQYANSNGNIAYYIIKETSSNDTDYLMTLYNELNKQISDLAISKETRFENITKIFACGDCSIS